MSEQSRKHLTPVFQWVVLVLISLYSSGVAAQRSSGGIKAGVNFANQSISPSPSSVSGITSFHGGFYYNYSVANKFTIQPELMYSRQGVDYSGATGDIRSIRLDYVNLPVLLRFDANKWFHVETGLQLGIFLSGTSTYKGVTDNLNLAYSSATVAFAAGAGVKLPARLGLSLRYVSDLADADALTNIETRNHVIQVSLDFRLFGEAP